MLDLHMYITLCAGDVCAHVCTYCACAYSMFAVSINQLVHADTRVSMATTAINSDRVNNFTSAAPLVDRCDMATSILPSPIRLSPMDRWANLSPAKRIAISPSHNQRPSTCLSVDLVDVESGAGLMSIDGQGEEEGSLVSLLRSVPEKKTSPNLKKFMLYPTLVEVYASLRSGEPLPARIAELLEDRSTKRRVYQTLFEVMHRKFAPTHTWLQLHTPVIHDTESSACMQHNNFHLLFAHFADHSIIEEMLIESGFYSRHFDVRSYLCGCLLYPTSDTKPYSNVFVYWSSAGAWAAYIQSLCPPPSLANLVLPGLSLCVPSLFTRRDTALCVQVCKINMHTTSPLQLHSHNLLVLVMAYELQQERFNLKLPRGDIDKIAPEVVKVGQALWQHKVKLSATIARMRVKADAQSITDLIPNPTVRRRYQASLRQPCYARVNMGKVEDINKEVISVLESSGYTRVTTWEQLQQQTKAVKQLRRDLLQFSADCRGTLDCIDLVKDGYIILQVQLSIKGVNLVVLIISDSSIYLHLFWFT